MKKRVLILSTSPRQGGNSDALAASFAEGARSAGHTVSHCSLRDKSLHFCLGCLSCQETPGCVLQDDMAEILSQMRTADVLVFATPIYFYEMSGQMKTLLDRTNPLFSGEYAFRAVYLLAAAAEAAPQAVDGALHGLEGWLACFPKATLQGVVCGCGVTGAGEIQDSPALSRPAPWGRSMRWAFFLAALSSVVRLQRPAALRNCQKHFQPWRALLCLPYASPSTAQSILSPCGTAQVHAPWSASCP